MSSSIPPDAAIGNIPALPPPPGVQPNFVNPESFGRAVNIFGGIFVAFMLSALSIRILVRTVITKGWGWDDCTLGSCNKDPQLMCNDTVTCVIAGVSYDLVRQRKLVLIGHQVRLSRTYH